MVAAQVRSGQLSESRLRAVYDVVLRRKGARLKALLPTLEAALPARYPELRTLLRRRLILGRQIASRILSGPGGEGITVHERLLDGWQKEYDQLGAELIRQVRPGEERFLASVSERLRPASPGHRAVAQTLPEGGVLVEYVLLRQGPTARFPARPAGSAEEARYVAFVLTPGGEEPRLQLVDLGSADRIHAQASAWLGEIRSESRAPASSGVRSQESGAARALADALIGPLGGSVEEALEIVFATDGDLGRLPLGALPDRSGAPLLERRAVRQVRTGQDLLLPKLPVSAQGRGVAAVVLGDPDLGFAAADRPTARPRGLPALAAGWGKHLWKLVAGGAQPAEASTGKFQLPVQARQECDRVANLLEVRALTGSAATRAALQGMSRPRILHLATGLYLGPPPPAEGAWENPLERTVLALAGGQVPGGPGKSSASGTLSVAEAASLDVAGSGVVLSLLPAAPEGVPGRTLVGVPELARTFRLAGANWVAASLWCAPPAPRLAFLENFYRRILSGRPVGEAMREAQMEVRRRYPEPACWAGWICQG
jgi:CHAT domain-containing protein